MELKSGDLQAFAKRVDAFEHTFNEAQKLDDERRNLLEILLDEQVKGILLPAVKGSGFKDQKLPLDWYEIVKNDYQITDAAATFAEAMGESGLILAITARLESVHVRLIGGRLIAGDVLFIKGNEPLVNRKCDYLTKNVSQMEDVVHRLAKEFPGQLRSQLAGLAHQYPGKFFSYESLPSAGKTKGDAFKDLQAAGLQSLVLGCSLSTVQQGYRLIKDDPVDALKVIEYKDDEHLTIGRYPLKTVKASFFRDSLYQLDIYFDQNNEEIAQILEMKYSLDPRRGGPTNSISGTGDTSVELERFGPATKSWTGVVFVDYKQRQAFQAYDAARP